MLQASHGLPQGELISVIGGRMSVTVLVGVRGESFTNPDGTSRQQIINALRVGDRVRLEPDPMNEHDRWAVKVLTTGGDQVGFLPSDARDASALLRGEPVSATIAHLTGGTNWFRRVVLGKKHVSVVLRLNKDSPDWTRYSKLRDQAEAYDRQVKASLELERTGDQDAAIEAYRECIKAISTLTASRLDVSAHRFVAAPVNRLSLLLERKKKYSDALAVIEDWRRRFDPIQPDKADREALQKREERLRRRLRQRLATP